VSGGPAIVAYRREMLPEVLGVWNAALGDRFPLARDLFVQNAIADPHFDPEGFWVAHLPAPAGVIGICLAKTAREPLAADGVLPDRGWISLLAVHPASQRRGVGRALLRQAEDYLRARGRRRAVLGGDPNHFLPGIPLSAGALAFFGSCGYRLAGDAYDLRRSLAGYETPGAVAAAAAARPDVEIRPLTTGEAPRLLAFLDETFPGRWRYTVGRFLDSGGSIGDIMGVVEPGGVSGFAHLFHPASARIGPSIAWTARTARRAGGLGPMGLARVLRGRGLGLALVDRAVRRLADLGIEEVVVDWTDLLAFYGRLGFLPWRQYRHGEKPL